VLFGYRLPFSLHPAPFARRSRNQLLYIYLPSLYLISLYDISNPLAVSTVTPRVTRQLLISMILQNAVPCVVVLHTGNFAIDLDPKLLVTVAPP
jgi:hypothetical protein